MTLRTPTTEARRLQKWIYAHVLIPGKHMEYHAFSGGKCGYSILVKTVQQYSVAISDDNAIAISELLKNPGVVIGYNYINSYLKFGIEDHLCLVIFIEVVPGVE